MRKTFILILCLFFIFSFFGCSAESDQQNDNVPTGFVSSVMILGEVNDDLPGFVSFYKTYRCQVSIQGYMEPEATYDVTVQIGFYSDGQHIKTVEKTYKYFGRESNGAKFNVSIPAEQCDTEVITARVIKTSWN